MKGLLAICTGIVLGAIALVTTINEPQTAMPELVPDRNTNLIINTMNQRVRTLDYKIKVHQMKQQILDTNIKTQKNDSRKSYRNTKYRTR